MIPGTPIAYWASENIIRDFVEGNKLAEVCQTRKGLATSDNNKFLRLWFEVERSKISFSCCSNEDTDEKWYPINKGGGFRRWYGNRDYIINWKNDGYEIRNFRDKNGKLLSRPQNTQYNFKQALTWSKISTADFSARFCEGHFLFDDAAAICHHEDEKTLKYVLAFLNSKTCQEAIKILNPTLNIQIGDIGNLPILINEDNELLENVDECIALTRDDWDAFETSWDFRKHPLIGKGRIADLYDKWCEVCEQRKSRLSTLEKRIDSRISDIYLMSTINEEKDVYGASISSPDVTREIKSLISYAVGCMFGRYSLDVEGLVYAGGLYDASKYMTYLPDVDGIIPITDADYFNDDIVTRFVKFIADVYGSDCLEENLRFVAMALGTKGDTDKEKIRNYFISDFYKDHCNTYSVTGSGKRPIYWLFNSGKQNGFKCLIYMHRYNKDTLNLIRSEYLHKTEDAVENALKNAEYIIQTSASAVERAKATKDRDRYVKQLNEMRIYYQALSHLALQKIEIDLDDGVKHNYQLFQGIEVIADGGKKQKVDLLAKI